MAKNNIEIQELIQHIKTNYQEGVDFKIPYWILKDGPGRAGAIYDLSPRLKSFLRKEFDFPSGLNDWLDYSKTDLSGNNYYYRLDGEHGEGEFEGLYFRHSNKGLEQEQPKKCKTCGKLTFEEDGRMWLWNKITVGKDFGQESKVIAYFHPPCAKRYFANQEPVSEMKARHQKVKEILLRNLDKICLDPENYLANIEYLKTDGAEEEYKKAMHVAFATEWRDRYMNLVIDGEEVDLEDFDNVDEYFEVNTQLLKK